MPIHGRRFVMYFSNLFIKIGITVVAVCET